MYIYVFEGSDGLRGFAAHADGLNLPVRHGPWVLINRLIMSEDDEDRTFVKTRECLDDIRTYGFHVTQDQWRVTDRLEH